jgi:16S rRNA (cytosine1402-N4)-methyltransferase
MYHEPVLLKETIEGLAIKSDGTYVDVTFGGGGHSKAILDKITTGRLIGFDQDQDALQNKPDDSRLTLIQGNFRHLTRFLKYYKALPVDGILADLGISSHQINVPDRGFSTRYNADLDMRMDQKLDKKASDIIHEYSEKELQAIFSNYGEIRNSKTLAHTIVASRSAQPVITSDDLKKIIRGCITGGNENRYLAQVFQSLRIEVNDEINALKGLLSESVVALKPKGRLVVISYHSLEDRIVKNFIAKGMTEGTPAKDMYGKSAPLPFKAINKKPVVATKEEIFQNSRSRSAKLRVAERI